MQASERAQKRSAWPDSWQHTGREKKSASKTQPKCGWLHARCTLAARTQQTHTLRVADRRRAAQHETLARSAHGRHATLEIRHSTKMHPGTWPTKTAASPASARGVVDTCRQHTHVHPRSLRTNNININAASVSTQIVSTLLRPNQQALAHSAHPQKSASIIQSVDNENDVAAGHNTDINLVCSHQRCAAFHSRRPFLHRLADVSHLRLHSTHLC